MTSTILDQTHAGLGIGFASPSRVPRKQMQLKPPPKSGGEARFELLPDQRSRAGAMGVSMTVQVCLVLFFVALPLFFPDKLIPKMNFSVMNITAPLTEVPMPKPMTVKPKPQPVVPVKRPAPLPTTQPKMIVPHVVAPKAPKVEKPTEALKLNNFEAPKVNDSLVAPSMPKKPVETGTFNTGSAAAPTISKPTPVEKVQTGGFGDPNGLPGPGDPNKHANINHVGGFDMPGGPGYGNGTGGANGVRGTVQSAGFGNGTAIAPSGNGGGNHGSVQTGGFSTAAIESEKPRAREKEAAAAVQPVEILDKPKPDYTADARAAKIEGEVLLQVVFKANGQIEVLSVKKGLGHGLDESAEKAAQKIRYKPAISNGQPVDFPATVHIVFQLAY